MSRKGNCWIDAVAESFFAMPKKELARDRLFDARASPRAEVFD